MEQKHKQRLVADWRRLIEHKPLHVLDIPDDYLFMSAELIDILNATVPAALGLSPSRSA
ncbi:hypothetical protein GCM10011513_39720 [Franconibacter daqui]|nr:hypothetical protein GCM10011513_39720 [Franconibacter daqui]